MRINHNLFAQNTQRNLGVTENSLAKVMEKLSSGLRINKASDDAAGLGVSEKMRGQVSALSRASENAQDGISLIQTAEGALDRVHVILRRIRDLSYASANGDKTADDRASYQAEADQLLDELDRISNTTEYNTIKLLTGALGVGVTADLSRLSSTALTFGTPSPLTDPDIIKESSVKGSVNMEGVYTIRIDTVLSPADFAHAHSSEASMAGVSAITTLGQAFAMGPGETETITLVQPNNDRIARVTLSAGDTVAEAIEKMQRAMDFEGMGVEVTWDPNSGNGRFSFDAERRGSLFDFSVAAVNSSGTDPNTDNAIFDMDDPGAQTIASGQNITLTAFGPDGSVQALTSNSSTFASDLVTDNSQLLFDTDGTTQGIMGVSFTLDIDSKSSNGVANHAIGIDVSGVMEFQVGPNEGIDHRISLGINGTSTKSLGISKIDISSQSSSQDIIDSGALDKAITQVSVYRGNLGAAQNRLEHTVNYLMTSRENMNAAESRIRDADIAVEMMELTRVQILEQAGTAMLAQANEITRSTLQLLG